MTDINSKQMDESPVDSEQMDKEIKPEDLHAISGGWGRSCYYSYSSDRSASYTSTSSNDGKN